MKSLIPKVPAGRRREHAFTMVEIVLSLAIIAVALVAIIGVLPIGLNVQSDNKEESIINADAAIWMQFLTKGAQGGEYFKPVSPLPGPIFYINEVRVDENLKSRNLANALLDEDAVTSTKTTYIDKFNSAQDLLGLLSLPKYRFTPYRVKVGDEFVDWTDGQTYTNWNVYADVRALNGNMADLGADMDFAFKYRMIPELVPLQNGAPYVFEFSKNDTNNGTILPNLEGNLYELRLKFLWPLLPGKDGDYRSQTQFAKSMTFRTLISGYDNQITNNLYFMSPRQFSGIASREPIPNP